MTHTLTHFEHAPLPVGVPIDDLSTGQIASSLLDSIGSAYNYWGDRQIHPRRQQFVHRGKYFGESAATSIRVTHDGDIRVDEAGNIRVTATNRSADLAGQVDELKALRGAWGQLWRRRIHDSQMTFKRCRLLQVRHLENVNNAERVAEVESQFETMEIAWRSEEALTVSGSATAGAMLSLTVSNAGALAIGDAILRVTATSGTITRVEVGGVGVHFVWTGTIPSGQVLEIDSGLASVTKGPEGLPADAYSGFALQADHTEHDWLLLPRGDNLIKVLVSGGNATITAEYYLLWP